MNNIETKNLKAVNTILGKLEIRQVKTMCPLHGEYLANQVWLSGQIKEISECPECFKLKQAQKAIEEEKARKEEAERNCKQRIVETRMPLEYQTKDFSTFIQETDSQKAAFKLARRFVKGWEKAKAGGYGLLFLGSCGTGNKDFSTFIQETDSQKAAFKLARRFVKGWEKAKAGGYGLLFLGSCGTGKTHLACAIMIELLKEYAFSYPRYYKASEIFSSVRSTYQAGSTTNEEETLKFFSSIQLLVIDEVGVQKGSEAEKRILFSILDNRVTSGSTTNEEETLKFFSSIQLLVIDEVGVQKGSEAEKRILFSILDNRVTSNKPTILMSNLGPKALEELLGDRLYDRVRSKCVPMLFAGPSMRKPATADLFD